MSAEPLPSTALTRVRITYGKTGALRYVGNLDMNTIWLRTLRRANLPLAYSKGFSSSAALSISLFASNGCQQPLRADGCLAGNDTGNR